MPNRQGNLPTNNGRRQQHCIHTCTNPQPSCVVVVQVHEEPYAERRGNLPSSLPTAGGSGGQMAVRQTRSFQLERQRAKHMQETWLLLEYCDKGSLQVCTSLHSTASLFAFLTGKDAGDLAAA